MIKRNIVSLLLLCLLLALTACQSVTPSVPDATDTAVPLPATSSPTVAPIESEPPAPAPETPGSELPIAQASAMVDALAATYAEGSPIPDELVQDLFTKINQLAEEQIEALNSEPHDGTVDPVLRDEYQQHYLKLLSGEGSIYAQPDPAAIGRTLDGKVSAGYQSYFDLMRTMDEEGMLPLFADGESLVSPEKLAEAMELMEPFCDEYPEIADFHSLSGMLAYAKEYPY